MALPKLVSSLLSGMGITHDSGPVSRPVNTPAPDSTIAALNHMLNGTNFRMKSLEKVPGDPDFLPGRTLVINIDNCVVHPDPVQNARMAQGYLRTIYERLGVKLELDERIQKSGELRVTLTRDDFNTMRSSPQYHAALKAVTNLTQLG